MTWDWRTNDAFRTCHYCGQSVKKGSNSITVGLCEEHERIWTEDIKSGFKQNRLKEIMIQRGEIQ